MSLWKIPMISWMKAMLTRPEAPVADVVKLGRCESRKHEGRRSWRCTEEAGHDVEPAAFGGMHVNAAGGRRW